VRPVQRRGTDRHGGAHAGHGWMMLMCVPMVAVVAVLIATGVASLGLIFGAIMCVAMMAMMMRMMSGGGEKR
jgi:hypothetical protein